MPAPQISRLDRAQTVAAKGLMSLPPRLQVLLTGGREKRIDGQQLDPQFQMLVALMNADGFTLRDPDHLVARDSYAHDLPALATRPPEVAWTRELEVAGRGRSAARAALRPVRLPRAGVDCSSSCTAAAGSSAT